MQALLGRFDLQPLRAARQIIHSAQHAAFGAQHTNERVRRVLVDREADDERRVGLHLVAGGVAARERGAHGATQHQRRLRDEVGRASEEGDGQEDAEHR